MQLKAFCNQTAEVPFLPGHRSTDREVRGQHWFLTKTLRVMRLTAFFLMAFCLHVSARGVSQTVTFSGKNVTLEKVFTEIERQTGYFVVWKSNIIRAAKTISIDAENVPVRKFLQDILDGQHLGFSIENETIFIRHNRLPALAVTDRIYPLSETIVLIAVTGRVTDEAGAPLSGVNVQVRGTTRGTITDANGNFKIDVEPGSVLLLTFIGYENRTIPVGKETSLKVVMIKAFKDLTDVVVTGFQDRKKAVSIGSVSVATAKDLENSGITTFDKALAGKMPGVYIRSESGRPGATGQIIIRGVNTLTGNVEPLYVLDGMPLQPGEVSGGMNALITNGIGNIPPENIESITILKDATAASIYGSRAANGVIVITTKNGKVGNDYVNYSGKFGITMMPENKFNFMSSAEKIGFERELYTDFRQPYEMGGRVVQLLNLVENSAMSKEEAERQIAALGQTNTDWIDQLYRRATSQSHNISLSGGNNKTTYFTSFNFQSSEGALIENKFQTGGMNMKLNRFITPKLLVKTNLYATIKKNQEGQAGMDPFKYAVFANPYEKPYNADGSYAADMTYRSIPFTVGSAPALQYLNFNMIRELRENRLTNMYGNIRGQISVEYDFFKNFKYTGSVAGSYTSVHDKDESFAGTYRSWANNWLNSSSAAFSVLPENNRGFLKESTGRSMDYTIRNTLEYNNTFNKRHFVQAFFANEFGGITNDRFNHLNPIYLQEYAIAGYPSWDLVPDTRFQQLKLDQLGGTSTLQNRSASFIASGAYAYDNRYVFNGNVRYDGVDIIGSDNQFSPLWSAGVKWNAHNESFFEKYEDVLSRLVVSVGYGYRGSINRTALPFHTYTLGTQLYNNILLANAFNYGNPVIRWEKKQETNIGLELSFLKGRINTDFRFFDEKVIDLLDNTQTPPSSGRTSAVVNVGTMSNKGYEVSARIEVIKSKDVLWEVSGNITQVKNKLINVYEDEVPALASATNSSTRNIEGYPVNGWFGYKFSHVDPETGSLMVYARKRTSKLVDSKVQVTYEDKLVDLSKTTTAVMQSDYRPYYLGHRDPEMYGGFSTRLVYKAFELNATFVLASGNDILSFRDRREGPSGATDDINASRTNRLKENLYRWRQAGDVTDIPVYRNSSSSYTSYLISTDVESGDYLKCNEMALSWRAQGSLLKKTIMKSLKATLVAGNLFILSKYSGTDPETQTPFGYPNTRNYTLSLAVGF